MGGIDVIRTNDPKVNHAVSVAVGCEESQDWNLLSDESRRLYYEEITAHLEVFGEFPISGVCG